MTYKYVIKTKRKKDIKRYYVQSHHSYPIIRKLIYKRYRVIIIGEIK